MAADDSALKYRALLQISEALIACRDRGSLTTSLWETLHPLIAFDFLVIVRYDLERRVGRLEAIAGKGEIDAPKQEEWPMDGGPLDVILQTGGPLYVPDISRESRFRGEILEIYRRNHLQSGFWVALETRRGIPAPADYWASINPDNDQPFRMRH